MLKTLLIGIIILLSFKSHCQVQMAENDKLATFCKVWGFLKYYHPVVATGKMKWDNEFRAKYKQIDSLNTKKEINKFYAKWLGSLGDVKSCNECKNNIVDSLKRNLDLSWMNDSMSFDKSVIKELHYIEKNRNQISKYYIQEEIDAAFSKEKGYYDSIQPSAELRMLGLARYWNIVNYFFAYKYLIGEDWNTVLTDMIPKFKDAKDTIEYHMAILELTARTNDSQAGAINADGYNYFGTHWAPFIVKIIENKAIVTNFYNDSLAQIDNIQYGDVILKINNIDIEEIIKEKSKYMAAGNEPAKLRKLSRIILNGDSEMVDISFERNGTVSNKTIHRYLFDVLKYIETEHKDTLVYETIDTNVGYINMGMLKHNDELEVIQKLKNTLVIILDLRNSTNNTLRNLAFLLSDDKKPFAILTLPNIKYPGVFTYTDPVLCGQTTKYYYPGKVILLINENTQGLAEFTCMGLLTAPNATTVGSQSAGAMGNVSTIIFPGGFETYLSATGVYDLDGKETQRVGITPDIEVKPTIEGIKSKRDELLEMALDIKRK